MNWRLTLATGLAAALIGGCANTPPQPDQPDDAGEAIQQSLDEGAEPRTETTSEAEAEPKPREQQAPPAAVSEALLPPVSMEAEAPEAEQRFDIEVDGAPARQFFMSLVEGTPYNMVVHPAVEGQVSLTLKNVTIPEVMDTMRDVYGYEYTRTRAGYRVLPSRLRSRIFQVNYLNVQRKGKSDTRVSSGQVSEGARRNGGRGGGGGGGGGDSLVIGGGGGGRGTVLGSRISTESESDFWKELRSALQTLVGSEGGRGVVISPQSSVVVVRAMPNELREVAHYLETIQGNLSRQVILEAKILEVELNDRFQSGINWTALASPNDRNMLFGNTGGGTIFGSSEASSFGGDTVTLNRGTNLTTGSETAAFGGVFSAALNLGDFNAFIELLETQGDVHVLSSPRVATVNNQKAVIKVGSDEFFVTDISSTTVTGTATTTTPNVTLTPFFSGIALDVTPQIDPQGRVTLHIHPAVSEVTDQRKDITVGGQTQSVPLAFSTVRESDSVVEAQSGQVIVIGGLMQNESEDQTAGTPVLKDVPIVGELFKHRKRTASKSELVILLRPLVVEGSQDWARSVSESADRVRELRRLHGPAGPQRPQTGNQ